MSDYTITTPEQAQRYIAHFKLSHNGPMTWYHILVEAKPFANAEVFKTFLEASEAPTRGGESYGYSSHTSAGIFYGYMNSNHYEEVLEQLSYSGRTKMAELFVEKYPEFLDETAATAAYHAQYNTMGALIKKGADANFCARNIAIANFISMDKKLEVLDSLLLYTSADITKVSSLLMRNTFGNLNIINDTYYSSDKKEKAEKQYSNNLKVLEHLFKQGVSAEQIEIKMHVEDTLALGNLETIASSPSLLAEAMRQREDLPELLSKQRIEIADYEEKLAAYNEEHPTGPSLSFNYDQPIQPYSKKGMHNLVAKALSYDACELAVMLLNQKAPVDGTSIELAEKTSNPAMPSLVKNALHGFFPVSFDSVESICSYTNTGEHAAHEEYTTILVDGNYDS